MNIPCVLKRTLFSCLMVLVVLGSNPAYARGRVVEYEKPMPEVDSLNLDEFRKESVQYKKRPYQQDELAYKIYIPKDWEQGEEKSSSSYHMNEKLFLELNVYYGKARMGGRSKIVIQAINMKYNLTAKQWYIKYILESGYTMQGFVVYDDKKVESLMIVMDGDTSFGLRTLAHINGTKMILVQYYLPLAYWEQEKAIQEAVIKSFELSKIIETELGKSQKFQFLDVAEILHPENWVVLAKPFRSVERMSVKFLNVKEGIAEKDINTKALSAAEGHVDVYLISKTIAPSILDEIVTFKRNLEGTGLLVGDRLEYDDIDYKFSEVVTFGLTEVYEGIDNKSEFLDYELWFTMLVGGNYFFFVTLLTPSQGENYIAWARNTQGYKQIVETLTPTSGSFVDPTGE